MLKLYHGSEKIIRTPVFGEGNLNNDYGLGFYCTEELELAKEWAGFMEKDGFANEYTLDTTHLSCLHLNDEKHHILNWLAILLENRKFDLSYAIARKAKEYIIETFLPDYKEYDLITGYRADDSYFTFAKDFLTNTITLEQLSRAMRLGKLGEQIVLKSPAAFKAISFTGTIPVDSSVYYPQKRYRDKEARKLYQDIQDETLDVNGIYVSTLIREQWNNDTPMISHI